MRKKDRKNRKTRTQEQYKVVRNKTKTLVRQTTTNHWESCTFTLYQTSTP